MSSKEWKSISPNKEAIANKKENLVQGENYALRESEGQSYRVYPNKKHFQTANKNWVDPFDPNLLRLHKLQAMQKNLPEIEQRFKNDPDAVMDDDLLNLISQAKEIKQADDALRTTTRNETEQLSEVTKNRDLSPDTKGAKYPKHKTQYVNRSEEQSQDILSPRSGKGAAYMGGFSNSIPEELAFNLTPVGAELNVKELLNKFGSSLVEIAQSKGVSLGSSASAKSIRKAMSSHIKGKGKSVSLEERLIPYEESRKLWTQVGPGMLDDFEKYFFNPSDATMPSWFKNLNSEQKLDVSRTMGNIIADRTDGMRLPVNLTWRDVSGSGPSQMAMMDGNITNMKALGFLPHNFEEIVNNPQALAQSSDIAAIRSDGYEGTNADFVDIMNRPGGLVEAISTEGGIDVDRVRQLIIESKEIDAKGNRKPLTASENERLETLNKANSSPRRREAIVDLIQNGFPDSRNLGKKLAGIKAYSASDSSIRDNLGSTVPGNIKEKLRDSGVNYEHMLSLVYYMTGKQAIEANSASVIEFSKFTRFLTNVVRDHRIENDITDQPLRLRTYINNNPESAVDINKYLQESERGTRVRFPESDLSAHPGDESARLSIYNQTTNFDKMSEKGLLKKGRGLSTSSAPNINHAIDGAIRADVNRNAYNLGVATKTKHDAYGVHVNQVEGLLTAFGQTMKDEIVNNNRHLHMLEMVSEDTGIPVEQLIQMQTDEGITFGLDFPAFQEMVRNIDPVVFQNSLSF